MIIQIGRTGFQSSAIAAAIPRLPMPRVNLYAVLDQLSMTQPGASVTSRIHVRAKVLAKSFAPRLTQERGFTTEGTEDTERHEERTTRDFLSSVFSVFSVISLVNRFRRK